MAGSRPRPPTSTTHRRNGCASGCAREILGSQPRKSRAARGPKRRRGFPRTAGPRRSARATWHPCTVAADAPRARAIRRARRRERVRSPTRTRELLTPPATGHYSESASFRTCRRHGGPPARCSDPPCLTPGRASLPEIETSDVRFSFRSSAAVPHEEDVRGPHRRGIRQPPTHHPRPAGPCEPATTATRRRPRPRRAAAAAPAPEGDPPWK